MKKLISLAALTANLASAFGLPRSEANEDSRRRNNPQPWSRTKKLEVAKHNFNVEAKKRAKRQRQLERRRGQA